MVESCYYLITADSTKWKDDSMIYIYMDVSTFASMYVYEGTDRRNATTLVQSDQSHPVGAPIRVPISSGAIIVLQISAVSAQAANLATATFSYKVVGTEYTWYEAPFVGLDIALYYCFLVAIAIALVIMLTFVMISIVWPTLFAVFIGTSPISCFTCVCCVLLCCRP